VAALRERVFLTPVDAVHKYQYPRALGEYNGRRAAELIAEGTRRVSTESEIRRFLVALKGDYDATRT